MFAIDASDKGDRSGSNTSTDRATTEDNAEPSAQTMTIPPYNTVTTEDDIWDANDEISARFLYVIFLRLQGLWIKSAQYLSSRTDFMPIPYVRELQKLQDSAPQTPWRRVDQMIPKHVLEFLTDINEIALASALVGQVHEAKVRKTGEKVASKSSIPSREPC